MSLVNVMDAARTALTSAEQHIDFKTEPGCTAWNACKAALADMPDQPMSGDDIAQIIAKIVKMNFGSYITAYKIIHALKGVDALYVAEEKGNGVDVCRS